MKRNARNKQLIKMGEFVILKVLDLSLMLFISTLAGLGYGVLLINKSSFMECFVSAFCLFCIIIWRFGIPEQK